MENKKEWFLTKELINIGGLPKSERGVLKKALSENWNRRQKKGVRGKVYEYHYSSFPPAVIEALGLNVHHTSHQFQQENEWVSRLKYIFPDETNFNQPQYDLSNIDNILKIKEKIDCDLNWLLTGQGTPFKLEQANDAAMSLEQSLNKTAQFLAQLQINKQQTMPNQGLYDTQGNPINIQEFVFIPYYNVHLSAGHGSWVDNEQPKHSLAFRRDWLASFITARINNLSVVKVHGDSMTGLLEHNDTILIDHSHTEPRDDVYAIRLGNEVFVKRVQRQLNKLVVISVNSDYPPFEIDLTDEFTDFAIIGKVVWLGRAL